MIPLYGVPIITRLNYFLKNYYMLRPIPMIKGSIELSNCILRNNIFIEDYVFVVYYYR